MVRTLVLAIVATLSLSASAAGDPVSVVTGGSYTITWDEESDLRLQGSGFDLVALPNGGGQPLFQCHPCVSGTRLDLSDTILGVQEVLLPAVFNGESFPGVFYKGSLSFRAGTVIVPDLETPAPGDPASRAELRTPFVASGVLTAYDNIAASGVPLFSSTFTGRGTATAVLFTFPDQPHEINADQVRYEFSSAAPVPEPGTLLLLGGGLAAGCAARRRSRRGDPKRQSAAAESPPPVGPCRGTLT